MFARNLRAVISVRGMFEHFIHCGCNKTNIIASRHHLLLVCFAIAWHISIYLSDYYRSVDA